MTVSIGVVSNSVQIDMKTLNGSEEVCVLRYHQEGWKKRSKPGVSKEYGEKNVCRGTRKSQEEGTGRWKQK